MRRAFTIIEVLVAMAIFAMAVIPLSVGYINVLKAYDKAKAVMQTDPDVSFARAALFTQPDMNQAMQGGQYTTVDGRQLTWTADILAANNVPDLFTVTFTCQISPAPNSTQQDPTSVTEVFWLLRPSWSDPTQRSALQTQIQQQITNLQGQNEIQ